MTKLLIFAGISLILLYISWTSIHAPGSHGFYRFFAWEFIAALLVQNFEYWTVNPFAWYQVISWILLFTSLIPLIFGVRTLINQGKPAKQRIGEEQLLAFEKTTRLVTSGIYQWIRHPLYSSLLLLTWGIFFKSISLTGIFLSVVASLFLLLTARADEAECTRFFGPAYLDYMQKTKRFIPFLF
jgi:protein-S-isoprenylcysteine O-methyltransferase Ste14